MNTCKHAGHNSKKVGVVHDYMHDVNTASMFACQRKRNTKRWREDERICGANPPRNRQIWSSQGWKRRTDVTFLCAVHYADAVVWDKKRRLIKHVLYLWEQKKQGQEREKWKKLQRNGVNVIYCNGGSSGGPANQRD